MGAYEDEYEWKSSGTITATMSGSEFTPSPAPVGVVIPLAPGTDLSGIFEMTYNGAKQIAYNFQNLVSTNHGERAGNPGYGANLRPLCAEYSRLSLSEFESEAMSRIKIAVDKFLPIVELDNFTTSYIEDDDPALLRIDMNIKFNIPMLFSMGNNIKVSFALL